MPGAREISRIDYLALADFRYRLRQFLRVREIATRAAGIEPQQYQLLLQIKGHNGHGSTTISALAERLQIQHHAVVQLVDRLVERDMVRRRPGPRGGREVVVGLRPKGNAILKRLAIASIAELRTEAPVLVSALRRLISVTKPARGRGRGSRKGSRS
jgi:DNA-binding MarR family transcriptional regulator